MLLEEMIHKINSVIWSPPLVFFCLFSGLYFSIRTRFIQFRSFKKVFKILFQKPNIQNEKKGISSFTAFCLSISGRVGTGNIAGVATAIAYGGPGALFWMWVVALLGASSAFIEAVLAQIYRERHDGHYVGGPSYYIKEGLKNKKLAVIFALVTILATGFCLPSVQSNSMTSAISFALAAQGNSSIKESYIGFFIVLFTGLVIFGGKKRIGQAANVLVPFMFVFYMLFAFLLILIHYQEIPSMLILIFKSAFGLDAQFGAILGQSILFGVKRGIFSNEAGQGTAPHAAASANVNHPVEQG